MSVDLERVLAESACRDTVLAAADAVDRQDHAAFVALFTADGTLVRPDGTLLQGREAIQAAYAARGVERLTRHLVCNHVVQVRTAGTATSRCTILLWSGRRSDPETPKGRPADAVQQVGEIVDQLVLTPEGWRIQRRDARFTFHASMGG
ncbi:MAG TPA: nuclear transport factor 2 family protein [Rubrivivax sp.]